MTLQKALAGLALLLSLIFTLPVVAADSANGKILHVEQCLRCHGSELYVRDERRVKSLDALNHQVGVCISQLGIAWFDEEKADVVQYLNDHYYMFP
jgi:hypothetical protein